MLYFCVSFFGVRAAVRRFHRQHCLQIVRSWTARARSFDPCSTSLVSACPSSLSTRFDVWCVAPRTKQAMVTTWKWFIFRLLSRPNSGEDHQTISKQVKIIKILWAFLTKNAKLPYKRWLTLRLPYLCASTRCPYQSLCATTAPSSQCSRCCISWAHGGCLCRSSAWSSVLSKKRSCWF